MLSEPSLQLRSDLAANHCGGDHCAPPHPPRNGGFTSRAKRAGGCYRNAPPRTPSVKIDEKWFKNRWFLRKLDDKLMISSKNRWFRRKIDQKSMISPKNRSKIYDFSEKSMKNRWFLRKIDEKLLVYIKPNSPKKVQKCLKMFKNVGKCSKMFFKMLKTVQKCWKMLKNV